MKQACVTMSILCVAVALGACGDGPAGTDESAMREAINEALNRFDAACIRPPLAARGEVFPATIEAAANGGEWLRKMESLEAGIRLVMEQDCTVGRATQGTRQNQNRGNFIR